MPANFRLFITRLSEWTERHAGALLPLILIAFAAQRWVASSARPLWFDEMFTFDLATAPTWRLFKAGLTADGNPPVYALLARVSMHIFGASEAALRLPSLIAYLAAIVLLYKFVRYRQDGLTALLAVMVFVTHPWPSYYATEARPYAIVLLFAALSLTGWRMAVSAHHPRRWGIWIMSASIAAAVLSYHMALPAVLLPVAAGELWRSFQRKRLDLALIGAGAAALLPLVYTLRLIRATKTLMLAHVLQNQPVSLVNLVHGYEQIPSPYLFFVSLAAFVLTLYLTRHRAPAVSPLISWPGYELFALLVLCANLATVFILIRLSTHYYAGPRYGISSFWGVAILEALLFSAFLPEFRLVLLVLLTPLLLRGIHPSTRMADPVLSCLQSLPVQPIVVGRGLYYPSAWHYAAPPLRSRLFYLSGAENASLGRYSVEDLAIVLAEPLAPMQVSELRPFLATNPHFLVVTDDAGMPDEVELLKYLTAHGFHMEVMKEPSCEAPSLQIQDVTRP
ncbi:MAG TPA: glycosyltransferase family 39 protein [Acidisarcina sp.]